MWLPWSFDTFDLLATSNFHMTAVAAEIAFVVDVVAAVLWVVAQPAAVVELINAADAVLVAFARAFFAVAAGMAAFVVVVVAVCRRPSRNAYQDLKATLTTSLIDCLMLQA